MDTIEGMRTFVAVVDQGSFSGAAERLAISSALASKYVGQLEKRLDHRLLNRTTRSLSLTEIGAVYLARCRQLLEDFDQLEGALRDKHLRPSGNLVVAAPVSFGDLYTADFAAKFIDAYPQINIELRFSDRFVNLVEEGIDVALRIAHLADSSLVARKLATVRIVACAAPTYLERRGLPTHPSDLERHDCVLDTNFKDAGQWPFQEEGRPLPTKVSGRVRVNSATAVRAMVLSGKGIGLIPSYAIDHDFRDGHLVEVLEAYRPVDLGLYAVYPHNRYLASKVRAIIDFAVEQFGNDQPWGDRGIVTPSSSSVT